MREFVLVFVLCCYEMWRFSLQARLVIPNSGLKPTVANIKIQAKDNRSGRSDTRLDIEMGKKSSHQNWLLQHEQHISLPGKGESRPWDRQTSLAAKGNLAHVNMAYLVWEKRLSDHHTKGIYLTFGCVVLKLLCAQFFPSPLYPPS